MPYVCHAAQYARLVETRVEGSQLQESMLFEPKQAALAKEGLIIEDGTVHPIEGSHVTLVVQNYGCDPIQLQAGDFLGQVNSVAVLSQTMADDEGEAKHEQPPSRGQV